jgi:hypothetical protein
MARRQDEAVGSSDGSRLTMVDYAKALLSQNAGWTIQELTRDGEDIFKPATGEKAKPTAMPKRSVQGQPSDSP